MEEVDSKGRYGGRGGELDGPRCGVGAEPTVKLVGGGMEAAKGDPRDLGRAVVTGEPKVSGNTRAAGRGHGGARCGGLGGLEWRW